MRPPNRCPVPPVAANRQRLAQILGAREGGYVRRLMFLLQEGLHGNLGNISNPLLCQCTRFGTKRLIERYLDEVCESMQFLCDVESPEISPAEKREFFDATAQTFGQSCLMLSGGAALGIYHLGVVKSLWENGLLPHFAPVAEAQDADAGILGKLMLRVRDVARAEGLDGNGYRVVTNVGEHAGQSVFHLHVHLLGGRDFSWPPG